MIISLLLMFIVADGCVFVLLAGQREDVAIKLMRLLMSDPREGRRSRSQSLSVAGVFSINFMA